MGRGLGGGRVKHFYSQTTSPWVSMLLLIQKYIKKIGSRKRLPIQSMPQSENIKNEIIRYDKQRRVLMANSVVCQSKRKPTVEPRRVKP